MAFRKEIITQGGAFRNRQIAKVDKELKPLMRIFRDGIKRRRRRRRKVETM